MIEKQYENVLVVSMHFTLSLKVFFFFIKMLCILQTLKMKSNNHDGYNGINIHFDIILKKKVVLVH